MDVLKLNKEQAEFVRGKYENNYSIDPIEIEDFFILPIDVLKINEYKRIHEYLKDCKIITINHKSNEI